MEIHIWQNNKFSNNSAVMQKTIRIQPELEILLQFYFW